ncbi:hypothetical protein, partial [Thermosulfurimonas dismutans]
ICGKVKEVQEQSVILKIRGPCRGEKTFKIPSDLRSRIREGSIVCFKSSATNCSDINTLSLIDRIFISPGR